MSLRVLSLSEMKPESLDPLQRPEFWNDPMNDPNIFNESHFKLGI